MAVVHGPISAAHPLPFGTAQTASHPRFETQPSIFPICCPLRLPLSVSQPWLLFTSPISATHPPTIQDSCRMRRVPRFETQPSQPLSVSRPGCSSQSNIHCPFVAIRDGDTMHHIRGLQSTPEPSNFLLGHPPPSLLRHSPIPDKTCSMGMSETSHLSGPFVIYLFACLDDAQRTTCFFPMAKSTQTTSQQQVINNHRGEVLQSTLSHRRTISLNHVDAQNVYQHSDDERCLHGPVIHASAQEADEDASVEHGRICICIKVMASETQLPRSFGHEQGRASTSANADPSPPRTRIHELAVLIHFGHEESCHHRCSKLHQHLQHSHTHTAAQDILGPDVPALLPENKESGSSGVSARRSSRSIAILP
ncbi:hypothetical protein BU15DRAFT_67966 [Melanogaster broomeanus]|nr:hypothetical protein BU15DRAFT_67966 [Melanogaster broomeanus]